MTGYGNADKEQVGRMVAVILQLAEVPTPDDTADALAIAICTANAERPGTGQRRQRRRKAGVLDRAAIAPIARGETPYERAVREALAGESRPRRRPPERRAGGRRPMIASVEGRVGAIAADSLVIEVGGIGYRVFTAPAVLSIAPPGSTLKLHTYHLVREDQQALFGFRTRGGARVLQPAAHGHGRRAQGRAGDRRVAADGGPPARDPPAGPGGPRVDPGDRQEARRADHLRAQGEGLGGGRRRGLVRGRRDGSEGEVVAALQALGYSLGEAREASRLALNDATVGAGLEERVKAALRTLLRD